MNHLSISTAEFERQKNLKAAGITAAIVILVLLIFIWVKMTIPQKETVIIEEFVEVNLGSGDEGFGTDQPLLPGDPAPAQQVAYTPPQPSPSREESVRDISSDDNSSQAPPVIKPAVSKPDATRVNAESKTARATPTPTTQPVSNPQPPQPRAVLGRTTGGNGNGGNGADTYRPGGNEGVAGGNGDQGRNGGDPNGRNYSGPSNFGVKVLSIPNQSFEDDFNRDAKVAMDVVVNEAGKVVSATYQPRGSTTADRKYIDIATRSAFQLRMGQSDGGQKGTVIFNFKVKG